MFIIKNIHDTSVDPLLVSVPLLVCSHASSPVPLAAFPTDCNNYAFQHIIFTLIITVYQSAHLLAAR